MHNEIKVNQMFVRHLLSHKLECECICNLNEVEVSKEGLQVCGELETCLGCLRRAKGRSGGPGLSLVEEKVAGSRGHMTVS